MTLYGPYILRPGNDNDKIEIRSWAKFGERDVDSNGLSDKRRQSRIFLQSIGDPDGNTGGVSTAPQVDVQRPSFE